MFKCVECYKVEKETDAVYVHYGKSCCQEHLPLSIKAATDLVEEIEIMKNKFGSEWKSCLENLQLAAARMVGIRERN